MAGRGPDLAVNNVQAMSFGKFVAGSGGTVTVSSGARGASGGILLMPSSTGSGALFSVTGAPNATFAISLPGNGNVLLTSTTGHSMAVRDFTSSSRLTGQLGSGGSQTILVGATLSVGNEQAPGNYSGSFDLTMNYN